ncbi:ETX/MTX2 family pore-forming toxin [Streptomyces sp. NPDC059991]|uniref:ETX/MTX2 family pore-forming toxin n=1 Tax=Streptomyces sp. NPDC059991 TaxID=3347028 RepID=UPI00369A0215
MSIRKKSVARFVVPVTAIAALAALAAPGDASAATHSAPAYPADLDGLLNDLVQYGDSATANGERHYASVWDNRHWTYQWGRSNIPTTSHVSTRNDASGVTFSNLQVTPDGPATTSPGATWYVGSASMTNTTDREMTLTTQGFSRKVTDTVSTAVTKQLSTSHKISAQVKLGDFISGGDEFTATWTWGETDTKTSSVEETYTASSQSVPVPPHTTAVVKVVLKQTKSTGAVKLLGDLDGSFTRSLIRTDCNDGGGCAPGHTVRSSTESVYDTALAAVPLPPGMYLSGHHTVAVPGLGTYTAENGSQFGVEVSYAPQQPAPAPGASAPAPAASRSYSYTVPAQKAAAPPR